MKKMYTTGLSLFLVFILAGVSLAGLTDGVLGHYPFNGNANDDNRIYNLTLSESEVQELYNDVESCDLTDSDGDGVIDNWDNCPDTPEGSYINKDGCPATLGDIDGDKKITLIEAIHALRVASGVTGNQGNGYDSLFMGHSFFHPISSGMQKHADRAGFIDHTQQTVFYGGASGAPQAIWENKARRKIIQGILDSGDIELFGMTYHPNYPDIDGYINWIEYALQQKSDTRFFVALPWSQNPGQVDITEYESTWVSGHTVIFHDMIDTLRTKFPNNDIFCIPYGQGAIELYKLFEAGNLPDVQNLVGGSSDAIFTDIGGHAGDILIALGQLIWLNAIYGVDLNNYDYDTGYITDLKAIAQDIMDNHDPSYNSH